MNKEISLYCTKDESHDLKPNKQGNWKEWPTKCPECSGKLAGKLTEVGK